MRAKQLASEGERSRKRVGEKGVGRSIPPTFPIETTPFGAGYRDGALSGGKLRTPRQVAEQHPEWTVFDVDCYLNGFDDGVAGDSFRLDRYREQLEAATPSDDEGRRALKGKG